MGPLVNLTSSPNWALWLDNFCSSLCLLVVALGICHCDSRELFFKVLKVFKKRSGYPAILAFRWSALTLFLSLCRVQCVALRLGSGIDEHLRVLLSPLQFLKSAFQSSIAVSRGQGYVPEGVFTASSSLGHGCVKRTFCPPGHLRLGPVSLH